MKKQTLCAFVVAASCLTFSATASGQSKAPSDDGVRAGIGVSLASEILSLSNAATGTGHVHIPVQIGSSLRLEPTFGFARNSDTDGFGSQTLVSTSSIFNLGIGAYYTWKPAKTGSTLMYVGPRFGFVLDSAENEDIGVDDAIVKTERSRTDAYGGVALGGEYFFAKTFSIGAETRLSYVSEGDTDVKGDEEANELRVSNDDTILLEGLVTFRLYFL